MAIKSYKSTTNGRRGMTTLDNSGLTKVAPEKSLLVTLKKNGGRNNQGKITVRHQGGGAKRKYRIIDFKRIKDDVVATVASIEYDPNRTANIALIKYADGEKAPYGYWTSTPYAGGSSGAWRVNFSGHVSSSYVGNDTSYGVRPVITISKSNV